jgi:hypothetical protein
MKEKEKEKDGLPYHDLLGGLFRNKGKHQSRKLSEELNSVPLEQ